MRIRPENLEAELGKALLPIYLVTGDEPLLIQEALEHIRSKCKQSGFSERKIFDVDRHFDWSTLNDEAACLSLFAEQKLTELRLGKSKPGIKGAKAIQQYCADLPDDTILLISTEKLDASALKSKWASTIDKAGAIIQIWPINLNEMPRWLSQRAAKSGIQIDQEAIALLSDRLEGNLLAAQQELEKLKLLYGSSPIDSDRVLESVADSAKYDIFNLTDACLSGNAKQVAKIVTSLQLDGLQAPIALWALSKEIRIVLALAHANQKGLSAHAIFKQFRIIQKRQALLTQAARKHSHTSLALLLEKCKQVDDAIKGIEKGLDPWAVLLDIALGLSGQNTG